MKKILYVVNTLPNKPNSVGNILREMISQIAELREVQQVIAHEWGNLYGTSVAYTLEGYKTYVAKEYRRPVRLMMRVQRKFMGSNQIDNNIKQLKKILYKENPDLVVFFLFSPELQYIKICKERNISFLYVLYDTYIARPGLNVDEAYRLEKQVIDSSCGYFVPLFFSEDYFKVYNSDKIIPYNLPLLIQKDDVYAAYQRQTKDFEYTYFGQIQSFRNAQKIQEICVKLGIMIDVFASDELVGTSDSAFRIHPALSGDDLYDVVAHSKFLVAFDNSAPYDRYLPSKVFLYVSFIKPVIAFGDNEESAMIDFFRNYPRFYYQNINGDLNGLVEFIEKWQCSNYDEGLYNHYTRFLPENALTEFKETIARTI